uniref:Ig-like domain-containing protein n=1 Tax=Gopherus evgoodei TaxID=1825980 RepID=A0A8C4WKG2_9SAUR
QPWLIPLNCPPQNGSHSQAVVAQEPSVFIAPGGAITLSCSLSTGAITTSNYPSWYQQKPGSAPRMLIYETNKRPSGIPARFSGSISSNDAALAITGVQVEDDADYYCAVYTGSSGELYTVIQRAAQMKLLCVGLTAQVLGNHDTFSERENNWNELGGQHLGGQNDTAKTCGEIKSLEAAGNQRRLGAKKHKAFSQGRK